MPKTTDLEIAIAAQLEQDTVRAKSVVGRSYKTKYAEKALTSRGKKGVDKRVVAQGNGDWLHLELLALTRPNPKRPLDIPALEAIFDANGVEHRHLSRTSPSWQGRLRMSGGLALRTIVAESGELQLPNGTTLHPPAAWIARWAK